MDGHLLGGGSDGSVTAEQLRARRLAALDPRSISDPRSTAARVAAAAAEDATRSFVTTTVEDDDEDDALQRALALSLQTTSSSLAEDAAAPPAPHRPSPNDEMEEEDDRKPHAVRRTPYEDMVSFHALMWDAQTTTDHDKARWVGQGIHVVAPTNGNREAAMAGSVPPAGSVLDELAQTHVPWGLQQQHGGPCGVLAAVQAEVVRILVWGRRTGGEDNDHTSSTPGLVYPTSPRHVQAATAEGVGPLVRPALARALALLLARAALTPPEDGGGDDKPPRKGVRLVLPTQPEAALVWDDLEPWSAAHTCTQALPRLWVYTVAEEEDDTNGASATKRQKRNDDSTLQRVADQVTAFLVTPLGGSEGRIPLDSFARPGGVLLLVMSMVASRGAAVIQQEFDDPAGTKLTAQFGHCSQELINLSLTGQAVSNVFDNTMNLGDAMVCRGISRRPVVGYLTQLEALRYCQVGGYYKSPQFPVWVVGSTGHFTVLFGDASSLEETDSDKLLEKCRRAFKEMEGGDETGFIPVDSLGKALQSLDLNMGDNVAALAAHLEVSGAGIILWDDFWKTASRLLTGATLESILGSSTTDGPPPLISAAAPSAAIAPTASLAMETDGEMAKRLAAEWEAERPLSPPLTGIDFLGEAARAASPIPIATTQPPEGMTADEALAWKLQAEWDAEASGAASVAGGSHEAVGGSPTHSDELMMAVSTPLPDAARPMVIQQVLLATPPRMSPVNESQDVDMKPLANRTVRFTEPPKLQFEEYGDKFSLYHYNGLRGGTLTTFRITRLSPEEAVGASIALNKGNASDGSGDLEDVVRTKWPSCMVDWAGKKPPFID